jgi:hypothetical protein
VVLAGHNRLSKLLDSLILTFSGRFRARWGLQSQLLLWQRGYTIAMHHFMGT